MGRTLRGRGLLLPLVVIFLSLFVLAVPIASYAQDVGQGADAVVASDPQSLVAIIAGLVGVLTGGGTLYRQQSISAGVETRMAALEKCSKDLQDALVEKYVRKDDWKEAMGQVRLEIGTLSEHVRQDMGNMREEIGALRRQNEEVLRLLEKIGASRG